MTTQTDKFGEALQSQLEKLSEEPKKPRTKKIFTLKMAGELMARGIQPIATEPNHSKPGFVVFIFNQTDELEKTLGEIVDAKYKKY